MGNTASSASEEPEVPREVLDLLQSEPKKQAQFAGNEAQETINLDDVYGSQESFPSGNNVGGKTVTSRVPKERTRSQKMSEPDHSVAIDVADVYSRYDKSPTKSSGGVIALSTLPSIVAAELQFLDEDGDGTIDVSEIRALVALNKKNRSEKRIFRSIFIGGIVFWLITLGIIGGCVYLVAERTKETRVTGRVLTAANDSSVAIQCANTDLIVKNGVMHPRVDPAAPAVYQNTSRLVSTTIEEALGVRKEYKQVSISSTLPDKYFKELEWLEIVTSTGLKLSLKVLGLARFLTKEAKCGTLLKIVTAAGVLILDDADIYYDTDLYKIFDEAGFHVRHMEPTTASSTATRKLYGRRLQTVDGSTITASGFFNAINEYDWKCESVAKPQIPEFYYMKGSFLTSCDTNECNFKAPNNVKVPVFGVTKVSGSEFLPEAREMFFESDGSNHVIRKPVFHPGVKSITSFLTNSDGTHTKREYQVNDEGIYSHCTSTVSATASIGFPTNFIFYPMNEGNAKSDQMHFRISIKREESPELAAMLQLNGVPKIEWDHIDYFENIKTKTPQTIITTDGSVYGIDVFKTGASQNEVLFRNQGVYDAAKFRKCAAVTDKWETGSFKEQKKYFENGSYANAIMADEFNMTASLTDLYNSWNWTQPYPPLIRTPNFFSPQDLKYYMSQPKFSQRFPLWVKYIQSNFAKIFYEEAIRHVNVTIARTNMMRAVKNDERFADWVIIHHDELAEDYKFRSHLKEGDVVNHHPHSSHDHEYDMDNGPGPEFQQFGEVAVMDRKLLAGSWNLFGGGQLAFDTSIPSFNLNLAVGGVKIMFAINAANKVLNIVADANGCLLNVICFTGYAYFNANSPENILRAALSGSVGSGSLKFYVDLSSLVPGAIKYLCPSCTFKFDVRTWTVGPDVEIGDIIEFQVPTFAGCNYPTIIMYEPVLETTAFPPEPLSIPIPIPIPVLKPVLQGFALVEGKLTNPSGVGGLVSFYRTDNDQSSYRITYANYRNYGSTYGSYCLDRMFASGSPLANTQYNTLNGKRLVTVTLSMGMQYFSVVPWSWGWKDMFSKEIISKVFSS